ncbi:MAG: DUF1294 domain-containing protein [Firmicutes bacterium]|nr:DUF1294 domain-containing protein [Bacillota bacterium]
MKLLILIMSVWNVITFLMMAIDKLKAKKDKRRISEKTLLVSSFLMGGIGIAAGGLICHHKTKKLKFQILVPLSLIVNAAVIAALIYYNIV